MGGREAGGGRRALDDDGVEGVESQGPDEAVGRVEEALRQKVGGMGNAGWQSPVQAPSNPRSPMAPELAPPRLASCNSHANNEA